MRKLIVFLCLTVTILAAIAPLAPGLLWALTVPLILFALTVLFIAVNQPQEVNFPAPVFFTLLSSRAPPLA